MSILATSLRAFWLPGLNSVTGRAIKGLGAWVADEEYQIYTPVSPEGFVLEVSSPEKLLSAIAADVDRCAIASFESVNHVTKSDSLPRSTAWLVITSYYAAFFAAHAIARMFGTAFVSFDRNQANSVSTIADLFGVGGAPVSAGYYECAYDSSTRRLSCKRFGSAAGGVHELFWRTFYALTRKMSNDVVLSPSGVPANNQLAAVKLSELTDNLGYRATAKGNWLSVVRNAVNYSHRFGTWFPYAGRSPYFSNL
jgi:hypothetical protein